MKRIQSKKHKLGTYGINKALSCFDGKIFILDDEIHTLACFRNDTTQIHTNDIDSKRFSPKEGILTDKKD